MPYSSTQMPAENLGLNPYCIHVMQNLKLDQDKGLHYYYWFCVIIDLKQIYILDCLFFSNETRFHLSAYIRSQNSRVWNDENSHVGN
jgi:hypothetical protein